MAELTGKYGDCGDTSPDHRVLYLQPRCAHDYSEGRMLCEDPQEPCENCGAEWIRFERATEQTIGR